MLPLTPAMASDASIYTKKYYRVLLTGIDLEKETKETFAIKLSMRLRTPMPRVRQLLEGMPAVVKVGLTVSQANTLRRILEEMGGKVSVEEYFLTPGVKGAKGGGLKVKGGTVTEKVRMCPACGWEEDEKAEYCSLCLERFEPKKRALAPSDSPPAENPLEGLAQGGSGPILSFPRGWLLIGVLIAVLLFLLVKK